jgi:hypothetical protein
MFAPQTVTASPAAQMLDALKTAVNKMTIGDMRFYFLLPVLAQGILSKMKNRNILNYRVKGVIQPLE